MKARGGLATALLALAACGGEPMTVALKEPIRISDAQFREGALPGLPPLTAGDINAGVTPKSPVVSGINLGNAIIPPREPGRAFSGLASPDAAAVGVRFAKLGSGYWLLPTRGADAVNDGALEWAFRAAFSADVPSGLHELLLAAVDSEGRAGNQVGLTLCLRSEIPDNDNACDPFAAPPALVVSLNWESAVDLDLRVVTPRGKLVDSKNPSTAEEDADGELDPSQPGVGVISHDSFGGCTPDGQRREDLVFQTRPEAGTYLVYANLYDACGQAGVTFDVSLHNAARGDEPGTQKLIETFRQAGQLQAVHANGGLAIGMYITSFSVK